MGRCSDVLVYHNAWYFNTHSKVLIQQNEYQFINTSMYCCVAIEQWIVFCNGKNFEIDILEKIVARKPSKVVWLYSWICTWGNYPVASNHIYARAYNTFKQWYIAVLWYFWHESDASILLEPVLSTSSVLYRSKQEGIHLSFTCQKLLMGNPPKFFSAKYLHYTVHYNNWSTWMTFGTIMICACNIVVVAITQPYPTVCINCIDSTVLNIHVVNPEWLYISEYTIL